MPGRSIVAVRNFFAAENRCYSRSMTAFLTDMAGLFVVVVLTIYFTGMGVLFYHELHGKAAIAAAANTVA